MGRSAGEGRNRKPTEQATAGLLAAEKTRFFGVEKLTGLPKRGEG